MFRGSDLYQFFSDTVPETSVTESFVTERIPSPTESSFFSAPSGVRIEATPAFVVVTSGTCPGRTESEPSAPVSDIWIASPSNSAPSGPIILSRKESLISDRRRFAARLLDGTHVEEGGFRQIVVLPVDYLGKTPDGVGDGNVLTLEAVVLFRNVERLR